MDKDRNTLPNNVPSSKGEVSEQLEELAALTERMLQVSQRLHPYINTSNLKDTEASPMPVLSPVAEEIHKQTLTLKSVLDRILAVEI